MSRKIKTKCLICDKSFYAFPLAIKNGQGKLCSKKCYGKWKSKNLIGEKATGWKGGKHKNNKGYILIHKRNHPFCSKKGYIMEHRIVMEKHLGRYLKPLERIHHIDGNPSNNSIKNLKLFNGIGEHKHFHILKLKVQHHKLLKFLINLKRLNPNLKYPSEISDLLVRLP